MKKFYPLCMAALSCYTYTAHGNEPTPLGYTADHTYYFYRVNDPDKSVQVGFAAGCGWYAATLARPGDFRSVQNFDPAVNHLYVGMSGEKNFLSMRVALASGLYFSQLKTYLFGWPYYKGDAYIIDKEDDEMVHYTTISDVRTTSMYVSIPLELSIALVSKPDFGFYLKGSAMANVNVHTTASLIVDAKVPAETRGWLSDYFKSSDNFFVNAVAGVGFRWGEHGSHNFRLEAGVPFTLLNKAAAYLNTGRGTVTTRVALYVPLSVFYN
jgi:hypothetical protein